MWGRIWNLGWSVVAAVKGKSVGIKGAPGERIGLKGCNGCAIAGGSEEWMVGRKFRLLIPLQVPQAKSKSSWDQVRLR